VVEAARKFSGKFEQIFKERVEDGIFTIIAAKKEIWRKHDCEKV